MALNAISKPWLKRSDVTISSLSESDIAVTILNCNYTDLTIITLVSDIICNIGKT